MKNYRAQLALLVAIAISFGVSMCSAQIDDYFLDIMLNVGINVILAVSLNLVNGHTGQFSLGHAAFMAVGAYGASVISLETGESLVRAFGGSGWFAESAAFLIALATGGICAAVCGLIVGVPSLRLRGDYLAIVTLGFNEIIKGVIQNAEPLGAQRGLGGIAFHT